MSAFRGIIARRRCLSQEERVSLLGVVLVYSVISVVLCNDDDDCWEEQKVPVRDATRGKV